MTDAPAEEFLELDGGRVHLLRGGQGEPLLFLHAAGGAGNWLEFHRRLAGGFDVIAPDHPGFGKSDDFAEVEAMDDLVYHYLDLMDQLGLERPHVVGGSFGGWLEQAHREAQPVLEWLFRKGLKQPGAMHTPLGTCRRRRCAAC